MLWQVAVCRAPTLTAFVFSLPDCRLLQTVCSLQCCTLLCSVQVSLPAGLEGDDMDQRFLMKDNTMIFMFHHPEFFNNLFNACKSPHINLITRTLNYLLHLQWKEGSRFKRDTESFLLLTSPNT